MATWTPKVDHVDKILAADINALQTGKVDSDGTASPTFWNVGVSSLTAPGACTAALVAEAGNVTAGAHKYKVTFVTATGETELGTVSNEVTADGGHGKVDLSAIPVGAAGSGVTSRKIYRTKAGDATNFYLLTTIADNTTATYQDNMADGNLGADTATYLCNSTGGFFYRNGVIAGHLDWLSTRFGLNAGADLTTGALTAFGRKAGYKTTSGHCTFVGDAAGQENLTGHATCVGDTAGALSTDKNTVCVGYYAGYNNTLGHVVAVGLEAAYGGAGGPLVAVGYRALRQNCTGAAVGVGYEAGYLSTTGDAIYVGYRAGYNNTTGHMVAIGREAAYNTTASDLVAIGYLAAYNADSTGPAVAIGYQAGYKNTTAGGVYVGYKAGLNSAGAGVVFVGWNAGQANTSGWATGVGYAALYSNTTGYSVGLGYRAGYYNTSGQGIYIGTMAGYGATTANAPATDTYGILIGYEANRSVVTATALTNYVGIGYGVLIDKSNQVKIGNASITEINLHLTALPTAANDAAAAAAGILVGGLYRTNADPSIVCIRSV